MATRRKKTRPLTDQQQFANEVRMQLAQLGVKEGYVVVNSIGPYDFNTYDTPYPDARFPRIFKALYEAVEYAGKMKGPYSKPKILLVDNTADPKTGQVPAKVVWRSWIDRSYDRDPRRTRSKKRSAAKTKQLTYSQRRARRG